MQPKWIFFTPVLIALGCARGFGQPVINSVTLSGQPQTAFDSQHPYSRFSASLGADVTLTVSATSTNFTPLSYQWRFNQNVLPGKFLPTLRITSLQLSNAGNYTVLVTDTSGTSSNTITLDVDSTFSKITTGPIVTDVDHSPGGTWGDYNNDGYLDLFVYNGMDGVAYAPILYRNNGDGTFSNVTTAAKTTTVVESYSACWGDYDNDGFLDLFQSGIGKIILYRNNGNDTFTQITNSGVIPDPGAAPSHISWIDYDKDGLLDLLLANFNGGTPAHPYLYHNKGDGTFAKVASGSIASDLVAALGTAWADYDNDGYPDLFISNHGGTNRLYHNDGNGTFSRITNGAIVTVPGNSTACAWGDYDNDGFLDLFVVNGGQKNFLYHNNGDGTFTRITNTIVANDVVNNGIGCAWGDYDNDGWLDLYVGNEGGPGSPVVVNFLYHNNGDGTFTKITNGSPVNEYSDSWGVAWGDYDNDGFLDLFASRGDGRGNFLYHNNGNSNNWLAVKLVGTASNRAAIGARVHVRATIGGSAFWQLRQITGGSGLSSGNELRANFGLGDATNVDTLRIEWPSGTVQEFQNVAAKQILTITEPARLLTSVSNGVPQFSIKGGRGMQYDIQTSADLTTWSRLGDTLTITNLNGTAEFVDTNEPAASRFYRAKHL